MFFGVVVCEDSPHVSNHVLFLVLAFVSLFCSFFPLDFLAKSECVCVSMFLKSFFSCSFENACHHIHMMSENSHNHWQKKQSTFESASKRRDTGNHIEFWVFAWAFVLKIAVNPSTKHQHIHVRSRVKSSYVHCYQKKWKKWNYFFAFDKNLIQSIIFNQF